MTDCPNNALLQELYELIQDQDSDEVIPMLISVACGCAAQDGINRKFITKYMMECLEDAYAMFTRDENEAVH